VANLTMQAKCVSPIPVAMVTKIYKFAHLQQIRSNLR